jgi:site-specific recombinase XerD
MHNQSFVQLFEEAGRLLQSMGYSDVTIKNYQVVWKKLQAFASEKGIISYTTEIGLLFLRDQHGITPDARFTERNKNHIRRSIEMLDYFIRNGRIDKCRHKKIHVWPEQYREFCETFMLSLGPKNLSERTLRKYRTFTKNFTEYLVAQSAMHLESVTAKVIDDYLMQFRGYARSTIRWYCMAMALFLEYAYKIGITQTNRAVCVPEIAAFNHSAPPSTYSEDEIRRILSSVDRANAVGKRDYAILLLAVQYGMRVGFSKETSLTHIIDKYLTRAGISRTTDRHFGMHTMRHSLASRMLEQGNPLHVISQTLGHAQSSSTMVYTQIDIPQLSLCALEVPNVTL